MSFKNEIKVTLLDKKIQTLEPFPYYLTHNPFYKEIVVPKGFISDLASIPRVMTPFIPKLGKYNKAAILHDYLYDVMSEEFYIMISREDADNIFLESMGILGVKKHRAKLLYLGVHLFGKPNYRKQ